MGYITLAEEAKGSYSEKKSDFIASVVPIENEEQAIAHINRIKAENRKARHNVYAYVLRENNITRYSDDGEPQGTAGVPVLDVLLKREVTDVCAVVTRYFGGVLLGANGLVRAYSSACSAALENAKLRIMLDAVEVKCKCDYSFYGKIAYILPQYEVKILDSSFGSDVVMRLLVKAPLADKLCEKLTDITGGNAAIDKSDIFSADFA